MDDKGNIYGVSKDELGKFVTENVETLERKQYVKMPNLFRMIPPEDAEKVKLMSLPERLEYYQKLVREGKAGAE